MNDLHIVFRRNRVSIVKSSSADWHELQRRFEDYMSSLGPWSQQQVTDYWTLDYGNDERKWPFQRKDIDTFVKSEAEVLEEKTGPKK